MMSAVLDERIVEGVLARAGSLVARLARDEDEVHAAQRLRWSVFGASPGANLQGTPDGRDEDRFDLYCRHLIVEDTRIGQVVGTYRLLMPAQARALGGLYMDSEFFTEALQPWQDRIVELGRSCVHPEYRSGGVILLLWSALGELLCHQAQQWLIGCASVGLDDGGRYAATVYRALTREPVDPTMPRVLPRRPLDLSLAAHELPVVLPPLLKGYQRAGAKVLGPPCIDPEFNCADIPVMLSLPQLTDRYAKRFLAVR
jgi:putative hemolysin